jgi:hypothetical protein
MKGCMTTVYRELQKKQYKEKEMHYSKAVMKMGKRGKILENLR